MFVWAKLKNTPVFWPAKVLHHGVIAARVYVKSDDAEFTIRLSDLLPFSHDHIKEQGIAVGAARSYESLKKITKDLDLVHPENITSVTMRKYTATLSQVIDLNKSQLNWLCKHIGHTKRGHTDHYQVMSGFIERVQVSKLLLVQDLNLTKQFAGKKLEDITFEDVLLERNQEEGKSGDVEMIPAEMIPAETIPAEIIPEVTGKRKLPEDETQPIAKKAKKRV